MSPKDKPLVWLHGQVKTPPLSREARIETGFLLRRLQRGERLSMPHIRPMPSIGARCRIADHRCRGDLAGSLPLDKDAIVIAEVFAKKTGKMPKAVFMRAGSA